MINRSGDLIEIVTHEETMRLGFLTIDIVFCNVWKEKGIHATPGFASGRRFCWLSHQNLLALLPGVTS